MKNRITLLMFFSYCLAMTAQHNYTLQEVQGLNSGLSKSFNTTMAGFQMDFVESEWRSFLLQYGAQSGDAIKNGNTVQIESLKVSLPVLNNELVDIMAELRPIPNSEGLNSVSLTFWIIRENQTYLDPKLMKIQEQKLRIGYCYLINNLTQIVLQKINF